MLGVRDLPPDTRVFAMLDVRSDASTAAAWWLRRVLEGIAPEAAAVLSSHGSPAYVPVFDAGTVVGPPGAPFAFLNELSRTNGRVRAKSRTFEEGIEERVAGKLGDKVHFVSLVLEWLDDRGCLSSLSRDFGASMGTSRALEVSASVDQSEAPGWVRLVSAISTGALRGSTDVQERWVGLLREGCARFEVGYGQIGFGGHETPWEEASDGWSKAGWVGTRECLSVLRGVGWLTLVPAPLVEAGRLTPGPLAELWPGGVMCLKASQDFGDYDEEHSSQVYDLVAPLLHRSRVRPRPPAEFEPRVNNRSRWWMVPEWMTA